MADKKNGATSISQNPHNEADTDEASIKNYADYNEVMAAHGQTHDMGETPNSKSGEGIMGGPAKGEHDPLKQGGR